VLFRRLLGVGLSGPRLFTFELFLWNPSPSGSLERGEPPMATVLIVEDEVMMLVLTQSVLQTAGYQTLSAGSIDEAQPIIESDANLDIVFTDLSLRDELDAGIEVGRLVEAKRPRTPVLYTSGREMTDGLKLLFIENSDFLPKPYTDEQLISGLAKLHTQ
jgi:CheY-like chemotaxis protein